MKLKSLPALLQALLDIEILPDYHGVVRQNFLDIEILPDYHGVVRQNFEEFITQGQFNMNQSRFLMPV